VLPSNGTDLPVRLVADERSVVVGIDTSGGGGRTGALFIVDPATGKVTDTITLNPPCSGQARQVADRTCR
jgi:hypothetical protein